MLSKTSSTVRLPGKDLSGGTEFLFHPATVLVASTLTACVDQWVKGVSSNTQDAS